MIADKEIEVFETTVGQITDVLKRLGVPQGAYGVTVMIEPDDWLTKARQESRPRVIAAGLSDDDIHRLIKRAQFVSAALKGNSLIETKRPQKTWLSKNRIILLFLVSALAFPALAEPQPAGSPGAQSPAVTAGRNVTTSYGLSPEQVQELTKAAVAGAIGPLADRIVDLSNRLGVTEGAAVTMLRIIGQQDASLELLPQKLAEVAERYRWARDRLAALDPQDPVTRELIERANTAIKSGHLDEADQLLSQAEQAEVAAAHQAQQAQATADQRLLRAAADRGVRGSIAMTRLRYLDAAQHFQEAANLVPAGRPNEKGGFLLATADALRHQGEERGDNAALVKAIETNQLALQELTRERAPLDWAKTQVDRGNVLERLSERESGTEHLQQAVEVYRLALQELPRERAPLDWAMTQVNLGSALA